MKEWTRWCLSLTKTYRCPPLTPQLHSPSLPPHPLNFLTTTKPIFLETAQTRKTKNRKNWPALSPTKCILMLRLISQFKGSACLFQSRLIQVQIGRWCLLVIVEVVSNIIFGSFVALFTMRLTRLIAVEMVLIHLQRSLHLFLRMLKGLMVLQSWMAKFGVILFASDKTVLLTFNFSHTIEKRYLQKPLVLAQLLACHSQILIIIPVLHLQINCTSNWWSIHLVSLLRWTATVTQHTSTSVILWKVELRPTQPQFICKLNRTIFGQFSFKEFLLLLESFFQIVTARQRLLIMQSKVNLTLFSIAVLLLWWYHPNTTIISSVTFSQWHLNWRAAKLFPTNLRVPKYNLIANTKNISYLSHSWCKTNGSKLTQVTTL